MLTAFGRAFKTPDLRRKLLFTLAIIGIYRLGSVVPGPGVSYVAIQSCLAQVKDNSLYGLVNLFSGGALLQLSVFALGIMPYITASIIVQLLVVVIPRLETLKEEGQSGQAKLTQYTRYLTVALAVLQSTGIIALARSGRLFPNCTAKIIPDESLFRILILVLTLTAGTAVIMWLGELVTDRGVGNGMSVLIFTSIISSIPALSYRLSQQQIGLFVLTAIALLALVVISLVV
ncbi:MAG: preprotein translocase subunit SecY, partial [Frankiales bacterium]|nr:preprotein translocase subunit SecY [Frankiales bacterium]